jgi:hypothetical protein
MRRQRRQGNRFSHRDRPASSPAAARYRPCALPSRRRGVLAMLNDLCEPMSWHGHRRCRDGSRSVAEIVDRLEHLQPMAKGNPEVLEVLVGQMPKDRKIDVVIGKGLSVLRHTEFLEPVRNFPHSRTRGSRRGLRFFHHGNRQVTPKWP